MKLRVHELAKNLGMTSKEVMQMLSELGENVKSASSTLEPSVVRLLLSSKSSESTKSVAPLALKEREITLVGGNPAPASKYGWHANPVPPMRSADVRRKIEELEGRFPVAADHSSFLRALGSQFVYANLVRMADGNYLGVALVRFSGAIEAAFGLTREVVFIYAPYRDLQNRTLRSAIELLKQVPREPTPDIMFFSAPDERLSIKLSDWSTPRRQLIPLSTEAVRSSIDIVKLLRDHVYARDLFYETTPVYRQRFFGRKSLLQELRDDVNSRRVSGIFGLRKSGKTSILMELSQLFKDSNTLPVFIDLEVLPSPPIDPTAALVRLLAAKVRKSLGLEKRHTGRLSEVESNPTPEFLKETLESVLARLERQGTSIVLMLDEIEFLTPVDQVDVAEGAYNGVAQSLGVLRSLVQSTNNFTFLLAGLTNQILENGRLYGRPNPLFSWAKARYVGPLSRVEADSLAETVGSRMGIEITEPALQALYDSSGGHAYLYRNLASNVVGRLPLDTYRRVMDQKDVLYALIPWKRSIAGNLEEIIGHLERYYPVEHILLELLLQDPEGFADLAKEEDVALHHLMSLGLVTEHLGTFEASAFLELRWK